MITVENNNVKILIVDDTAENLEIAGKILERENYDIYIADSGQSALELTANTPFDLILLDVMMPVMDGFETCRRIKAIPGQAGVPIIFLTAKVDIESIIKGFEAGAVDYIRKPFNDLELIVRVRNHVVLKKIREDLEMKNRKLEEAYAVLREIATTDPLTKLFNRREIIRRIEEEQVRFERNRKQFSLIIADIDHFKRVNDNYGHECGDFALKSIADVMKDSVRRQDFVSRWGGEEFLFLLPETDVQGAAALAEKIRSRIQEMQFRYKDMNITVTVTFGVAAYSADSTVDELINQADKALYKGKKGGRNRVVAAK